MIRRLRLLAAAILVPAACLAGGLIAPAPAQASTWTCGAGTASIYNSYGTQGWNSGNDLIYAGDIQDHFCTAAESPFSGYVYIKDTTQGSKCVTWVQAANWFDLATCGQYPASQSYKFTSVSMGLEIYNYYAGDCEAADADNIPVYGYACANFKQRTWSLAYH